MNGGQQVGTGLKAATLLSTMVPFTRHPHLRCRSHGHHFAAVRQLQLAEGHAGGPQLG